MKKRILAWLWHNIAEYLNDNFIFKSELKEIDERTVDSDWAGMEGFPPFDARAGKSVRQFMPKEWDVKMSSLVKPWTYVATVKHPDHSYSESFTSKDLAEKFKLKVVRKSPRAKVVITKYEEAKKPRRKKNK